MLNTLLGSLIWGDHNAIALDDCATVVDKTTDESAVVINEDATIVE